jgi:hypothetical protein
MAVNFPANAFLGQQLQSGAVTYTYNGVSWSSSNYTANVATTTLISDVPPASPTVGNMWWQSNVGALRIYYTDSSGNHWVDANPSGTGYYVTPGGASGALQFNNAGAFNGGNVIFDSATGNLVISSTVASTSTTTGALIVKGGVGVAGNVTSGTGFNTTNFSMYESGGKLYFKYQGTVVASMSSTGTFTALGDVGAFGTP